MENARIKFYEEKTSFWPQAAVVMLVIASVCQFVGNWGLWTDRTNFLIQVVLPIVSFLCYALLLMLLGKHALWLTFLPFLTGILYFALDVWYAEDKIIMIIGVAYCVLAVVLYLGTVFSIIRTKWLLVPLFAIPFLYRAFYRDVLILQQSGAEVSFTEGLREMSLLCVLLAMTFASVGMRKRVKEKRQKPSASAGEPAGREPAPAAETPAPAPAPVAPPAVPAAAPPALDEPYTPSLTLDPDQDVEE